jgi:hypothetical protein
MLTGWYSEHCAACVSSNQRRAVTLIALLHYLQVQKRDDNIVKVPLQIHLVPKIEVCFVLGT